MHSACARRHDAAGRDSEPGIGLVEVLNLKRLAGAGVGNGKGAGLAVVKPLVGNSVAVRIGCAFGAEVDAFAAFGSQFCWMAELRHRRMVGCVMGLDGPVHTCDEIVLIGGSPTPNSCVVAGVPAAVHAEDLVHGVGPERAGLGLEMPFPLTRGVELVATAPTAPVGTRRDIEPVIDHSEETRCVTLHEILHVGILFAKWTFAANVLVEPGVIHNAVVCTGKTGMKVIAADTAPGGEVIRPTRMETGACDIE